MAALPSNSGKRSVNILGSTGSIGCNTLDVIRAHRDKYQVRILAAYRNVELLAKQAIEFAATDVVIVDPLQYHNCRQLLDGTGIKTHAGIDALLALLQEPTDITVSAIVGVAGLRATLAATKSSKIIALANKESVVCGGHLLRQAADTHNTEILPLDSEHCAILQVMAGQKISTVERLTLTASGGPCREMARAGMANISPEFATNHPTWKMGAKISVDSATLFNKGLEVIEAYYFFPLNRGNVDVVIHPQSIVHAMVNYCDGSSLAQLSLPDMRVPISYIMSYPERIPLVHKQLDLASVGQLSFFSPDFERFPLLQIAMSVVDAGAATHITMNAANEAAVHLFLNGKIGFLGIERMVDVSMSRIGHFDINSVDDVYALHDEVYNGLVR